MWIPLSPMNERGEKVLCGRILLIIISGISSVKAQVERLALNILCGIGGGLGCRGRDRIQEMQMWMP